MFPILIQQIVTAVHEPPPQPSDDRITMMLTAVAVGVAAATLVLAALAIFLAYITFVGKAEIIQKAEAAAKKAAEEYLERNEGIQELDDPAVEPDEPDAPEDNPQAEYGDNV
jgi:hypothetical protein